MSKRRRERTRSAAPTPPPPAAPGGREDERLRLTRWTGMFGGAGVAAVLLGFILLSQGSLSFAPVLLVLGFLVFFPLALAK